MDGFGQNFSSVGYWIRGIDITTLLVPSEGPKKARDFLGGTLRILVGYNRKIIELSFCVTLNFIL